MKARSRQLLFDQRVDRRGASECWPWTGTTDRAGYGEIHLAGNKRMRAHRLSYELHVGPLSASMVVCHRCDNPPCVNPAHLFLGTTLDNNRDRHAKGRDATGARSGWHTHPELRLFGDRNPSRLYPERRPRGSAHARARIDEAAVVEIRRRYRRGLGVLLAQEFGISASRVCAIARGDGWSHVGGAVCA